jgi:hypothetical protein
MTSSFATSRRAVVALMTAPTKGRAGYCGLDDVTGRRPWDPAAGPQVLAQVGDRVGNGANGFHVQVVDAPAAPGGVRTRDSSAHVAVLDGQRDQPARPTGDVPGQRPAETHGADGAVAVGRNDLMIEMIEPVRFGALVGPGHEHLDPIAESRIRERSRSR